MALNQSVGRKVFGKTAKKAAAKAASKAVTTVSEHAGEKVGDKIIELLHKKKTRPVQSTMVPEDQPMSDYDVNERVSTTFWWKTSPCSNYVNNYNSGKF